MDVSEKRQDLLLKDYSQEMGDDKQNFLPTANTSTCVLMQMDAIRWAQNICEKKKRSLFAVSNWLEGATRRFLGQTRNKFFL